MSIKPITFVYRNYKGETQVRHIVPLRLEYLRTPGFDYQPGWFLTGEDLDRERNIRSFSLDHIILEAVSANPRPVLIEFKDA